MSTVVEVAPRKPRTTTMLALILLFALPPIAGWFFFLNPQLLPSTQSNNGTIIEPARAVSDLQLITRDGTPFDWSLMAGKWVLITYADKDCTEACIERLKNSGQIRKAVGANRQRVERLLLIVGSDKTSNQQVMNDQLNGATLLTPLIEMTEQVLSRFTVSDTIKPSGNYLIDPYGSLMMHHPVEMPEKMILRDLEKLLKASQDWANGGQYGHR